MNLSFGAQSRTKQNKQWVEGDLHRRELYLNCTEVEKRYLTTDTS